MNDCVRTATAGTSSTSSSLSSCCWCRSSSSNKKGRRGRGASGDHRRGGCAGSASCRNSCCRSSLEQQHGDDHHDNDDDDKGVPTMHSRRCSWPLCLAAGEAAVVVVDRRSRTATGQYRKIYDRMATRMIVWSSKSSSAMLCEEETLPVIGGMNSEAN